MPEKIDIFTFNLHFSVLLFELITSVIVFILALIVFFKWKKRKTKPTLYLSIALFSIGLAAFIGFTGLFNWFILWILSGYSPVLSPIYYQLSLPLGYLFVIPYDIFLILFTIHIFLNQNEKKVIPFIIIGIFVGILLLLPTNYWGVNPISGIDPPSTRTLVMLIFLAYNVVIYIILSFYAFKESKKTNNPLHKKGFQAIGLGQIFNILVFVFFLGDSVLILLDPASPGFSIFIDLSWIAALLAAFLFYIGFTLPEWFRNLIEKK